MILYSYLEDYRITLVAIVIGFYESGIMMLQARYVQSTDLYFCYIQ